MICIPITSGTLKEALRAIERSCQLADVLELRMDLIGKVNLVTLISAIRDESDSIKIIVTCRRKAEAAPAGVAANTGRSLKSSKEKMAILKLAIELKADFVDIELAAGGRAIRELKSLCAGKGNKTHLIISYHNLQETPPYEKLKKIFHQCARYQPDVVKIVTTANAVEDNLTMLSLIPYARSKSQKIISLCMGDQGSVSRAVAPLMGNFLSFASLDRAGRSAPGQFTVNEMNQIQEWFRGKYKGNLLSALPLQKSIPKNYVLLGNPVEQSLSPLMHETALRKIGIDEKYVAFCVQDISRAMEGIRGMNIRGASVTIPFKIAVMEYLDDINEAALEIGAVNTIVNDHGRLVGYNTDWLGLILTLKKSMTIKNRTFVIVGAGGTARAAVYGILKEGGFPIIVNRTLKKAEILSEKMQCPFYPLSELGRIKADGLINTTPVGMYPQRCKSPVNASILGSYKYVMDVIYNPLKTKLLADAEKRGCRIFSGVDMFVNQGAEQIRLWTEKEPPLALMKKTILEQLTKSE